MAEAAPHAIERKVVNPRIGAVSWRFPPTLTVGILKMMYAHRQNEDASYIADLSLCYQRPDTLGRELREQDPVEGWLVNVGAALRDHDPHHVPGTSSLRAAVDHHGLSVAGGVQVSTWEALGFVLPESEAKRLPTLQEGAETVERALSRAYAAEGVVLTVNSATPASLLNAGVTHAPTSIAPPNHC